MSVHVTCAFSVEKAIAEFPRRCVRVLMYSALIVALRPAVDACHDRTSRLRTPDAVYQGQFTNTDDLGPSRHLVERDSTMKRVSDELPASLFASRYCAGRLLKFVASFLQYGGAIDTSCLPRLHFFSATRSRHPSTTNPANIGTYCPRPSAAQCRRLLSTFRFQPPVRIFKPLHLDLVLKDKDARESR